MEERLEAWSGSGVNSEEYIPPTLIGTELEKTGKLTKDKNINEEKETEESKFDNFEEGQASITSIKNKNDKIDESITPIKKITR